VTIARNAGDGELLRFMAKIIFVTQMIVNLAIPAYIGNHDSPSMMKVIDTMGRLPVLAASLMTTMFLLLAFWIRSLRVAGGAMHAVLCLSVAVISLKEGFFWSFVMWFAYAFGGTMLAATGWRKSGP